MNITLINCSPKLALKGIYMEEVGAFDKLYDQIYTKLPFTGLEFDFSTDSIKITVDNDTPVVDLSDFGEVVPNDSSMG